MATWTIYKKLNVSPNSYPLVIPIKQYSSDFALKFKLYSTEGDLDIVAGATTKIRGTKRDGNGFELTGTRIGHTCTFSGTKAQMQQMTAAHGRCVFEVVVEQGGRELITANFYLEVQRAAMDAGTVTSESIIEEFADFQSKITAAQAAATAAQEQADRAEAAAESIDFGLDSVPTQGSANAVSSGGVYSALAGKVDAETGKGLSTNDYTDAEKQKVTDATADLSAMTTATAEDAGKALKAKTVSGGKVTEWEFGEAGGVDLDPTLADATKAAPAKTVGDELFADTSTETPATASTTTSNWRLKADGYAEQNQSYNLKKYQVTAGNTIKVVSDDFFQFQTSASVPTSGTQSIVGETYATGTFTLEVPATATYLIVSTPKTNSQAAVYNVVAGERFSKIGALTDRLDAIDTATAEDVGKALKAKTVTDGKVTEWEFGNTGGTSTGGDTLNTYVKNNIAVIPNLFGDPTFEDTDNENIYTFSRINSHVTENGQLTCVSSSLGNQSIRINCGDSESTDILYYNIKFNVVGITDSSITVAILGKNHTVTEDGTYTFSGYAVGGTGKFLKLTYGGTGVRTTIMYCPIVINMTDTFGADGIPTLTDFESVLSKFDRDLFGEWISKEKYDYLKQSATKYNAVNFAVPSMFNQYGNVITKFTDSETTKTGTGTSAEVISDTVTVYGNADNGDVIYASITAKATDSVCGEIVLVNGTDRISAVSTPTENTWYRLSGIFVANNLSSTGRYFSAKSVYADETTQNGKELIYKYGIGINLTRVFGAGHEPMDVSIVDSMLSKFPGKWYAGTNDIWDDSYAVGMLGKMRNFSGGEKYGVADGRFVAGSVINSALADWAFDQYSYGLNKFVVPVNNKFEGGIETNGMVSVFPKYGRWEKGAADRTGESGSIFGGHVFEAWNNIGSYRLTIMMAHGGDEREDEACIITYCPGTFESPLVPLTPEQEANRITRETADAYGGGTMNFMQGRIRIGSDRAGEGTVFRAKSTKFYGSVCFNGSRGTVVGATNVGTKGDMCFDDNYLYICVDDNTWKRIPLTW